MSGGRVFYAVARDGRAPAWLGVLNGRGAPARALAAQAAWGVALLLLPGASFGALLDYFGPVVSWCSFLACLPSGVGAMPWVQWGQPVTRCAIPLSPGPSRGASTRSPARPPSCCGGAPPRRPRHTPRGPPPRTRRRRCRRSRHRACPRRHRAARAAAAVTPSSSSFVVRPPREPSHVFCATVACVLTGPFSMPLYPLPPVLVVVMSIALAASSLARSPLYERRRRPPTRRWLHDAQAVWHVNHHATAPPRPGGLRRQPPPRESCVTRRRA